MATAILKRVKISKMHQHIIIAVLVTSIGIGVTLVFLIYLFKYVSFNGKVIEAKDQAIDGYYTAISNVGICKDPNKDGKYSDAELSACDPEQVDAESMPGTLRYKVLVNMANNMNLESVARSDLLSECYSDGKKIDFGVRYREAVTDAEREEAFSMLKKCSALRVVPDALPAQQNEEALLASLNQIFILSDWEPEALSPGSSAATSSVPGLGVLPVNLSVKANATETMNVLSNIERSIREFDITTATITWSGSEADGSATLELQAQANAYYSQLINAGEDKKTVRADNKRKGNNKK